MSEFYIIAKNGTRYRVNTPVFDKTAFQLLGEFLGVPGAPDYESAQSVLEGKTEITIREEDSPDLFEVLKKHIQ